MGPSLREVVPAAVVWIWMHPPPVLERLAMIAAALGIADARMRACGQTDTVEQ